VLFSCTNLKRVISDSYTIVDGCRKLTAIEVDPGNPNYSSYQGVLMNKDQTKVLRCPEGKTGTFDIPNSVTSVPSGSFYNCSLTEIRVPDSVDFMEFTPTCIDPFDGCSNLIAIHVGERALCTSIHNRNYV